MVRPRHGEVRLKRQLLLRLPKQAYIYIRAMRPRFVQPRRLGPAPADDSPTRGSGSSAGHGRDKDGSSSASARRLDFVVRGRAGIHSSIFVLDQDEALDFYVGKLGLGVHTDIDVGFMRWLTVAGRGDPDREILLEKPCPPAPSGSGSPSRRAPPASRSAIRTDGLRKTPEMLKAKGVEFTDEPTERFHGIDCGVRDPFGNHIRLVEPAPGPIVAPEPAEYADS
jgi:catechol 2,3-dioxygenase-like lactoylglutathione lyase family enzyme